MKVVLVNPPSGYMAEAEYRAAKIGEYCLFDNGAVIKTAMPTGTSCLVLNKIKPPTEPWTQQIAAEACCSMVWLRRKSSPQTYWQITCVDPTGVVLANGAGHFYIDLADHWEHCHVTAPYEKTVWYPCTVDGWDKSSIPF